MKITIEVDESLKESQLVLRCAGLTEDIMAIQKKLMDLVNQRQQLLVNRGEVDYYLVLESFCLKPQEGSWRYIQPMKSTIANTSCMN